MLGSVRSPNFARACISLSILSLTEIWDNLQRKEILAAWFCASLSVVLKQEKANYFFNFVVFFHTAPVSQSLPTNPVAQSHLKLFRRYWAKQGESFLQGLLTQEFWNDLFEIKHKHICRENDNWH